MSTDFHPKLATNETEWFRTVRNAIGGVMGIVNNWNYFSHPPYIFSSERSWRFATDSLSLCHPSNAITNLYNKLPFHNLSLYIFTPFLLELGLFSWARNFLILQFWEIPDSSFRKQNSISCYSSHNLSNVRTLELRLTINIIDLARENPMVNWTSINRWKIF